MTLYFITGNDGKFEEAKAIIPQLEQLKIDLPEIQSIEPKEIIEAKLAEARKHHEGEFIVEDTSLCIDGMHGLPGPLVKWFLKAVGPEGLYRMAKANGSDGAEATAVIGHSDGKDTRFFTGSVRGKLVPPSSMSGFGWDPIFQPEGYQLTFAEMPASEKNRISHRRKALEKLKEAL